MPRFISRSAKKTDCSPVAWSECTGKVIHVRFDDALLADAHHFMRNVLVTGRHLLQELILLLEKGGAAISRQSMRLARMLALRQPLSRSFLMIILRSFPLPGYERRCKLVILSWQQ